MHLQYLVGKYCKIGILLQCKVFRRKWVSNQLRLTRLQHSYIDWKTLQGHHNIPVFILFLNFAIILIFGALIQTEEISFRFFAYIQIFEIAK